MTQELFFNSDFLVNFEWKGKHFKVGSVGPRNKTQISNGLRDLSPESIRNRFLGSKKQFSDEELKYLTVLDGWNHYAMGIEEAGESGRGIALIRLVRSAQNKGEAEIAITVIDEFQACGLGTFLMRLMVLAAKERGIEKLSFTHLPQNEGINKLIERIGTPEQGQHNQDVVQIFLNTKKIETSDLISQLVKTLPEIGNFHLET